MTSLSNTCKQVLSSLVADSGHRDTPVFPKGIAAQQTSRQLCQSSTPDQTADKGPAANCASVTPWTSCHGNALLSPETDLQTAPWGDLVSDFWEEDDFDEPLCKAAKVSEVDCSNLLLLKFHSVCSCVAHCYQNTYSHK